jgi:two-component system sensor histidine kinase/response regulator
VTQQDGLVIFSIKDTGIGIAQDKVDHLFEPFIQADASTTRIYGGTGLGLSICKGIIEKMGGKISVETKLDQGSTFSFQIQLEATDSKSDFQFKRPSNLTCLLHCTNDSSCGALIQQLSRLGITTIAADSAAAFLQEIEKNPYSLAFIDGDSSSEAELFSKANQASGTKRVRLYSVESRPSNLSYDLIIRKPISPSELDKGIANLYYPLNRPPETAAKSSSFETLALQNKTFLLAEDNQINQLVAVEMLKRLGIKLDLALNGKQALELVAKTHYDFVFMDVQMPEIDGLEATRLIRQNESIRQPYIIAMTANAMEEDRQTCLAAGMNDFLSKPLSIESLYRTLESAKLADIAKPSPNLQ